MAKLFDNSGSAKIGKEGLRAFCEQLNAARAQKGFPARYRIVKIGGVETMVEGAHGER